MKGNKVTDENDNASEPDVDTASGDGAAAVDVSTYEAKINRLAADLAERDTVIAGLTNDLTAAKAANYDLLMSLPKEGGSDAAEPLVPESTDSTVDIDDLFEK